MTDPKFVRVNMNCLSESFVYGLSNAELLDALNSCNFVYDQLQVVKHERNWDSRQAGMIERAIDDVMQGLAIIREIAMLRLDPAHEYVQPYVDLDRIIVRSCNRKGWATYENIRSRIKRLKGKSWTAEEIRERLAALKADGRIIELPPSRSGTRGGNTPRYCAVDPSALAMHRSILGMMTGSEVLVNFNGQDIGKARVIEFR